VRLQRTKTKEKSGMEVCHGRIVISVRVISGTPQDGLLPEWLQGASIVKHYKQ
jgi:hypothetical protein